MYSLTIYTSSGKCLLSSFDYLLIRLPIFIELLKSFYIMGADTLFNE